MQKDVILFPNHDLAANPDRLIRPTTLPTLPVELGQNVQLEKLSGDLAEQIMDACQPRGHNFQAVRQYSELYTFSRENPPADATYQWDSDRRLQECIAVSRIIRPTSVGFKYSARLRFSASGELEQIIPGPVGGFGAHAWIIRNAHHGDWLDETDVADLSQLWSQADLASLPYRIRRALWYFEYAARTYLVAIRWVLMTTGIEALTNTARESVTKQFTVRFSSLARTYGRLEVSNTIADMIYDLRSKLAHGMGVEEISDEQVDLYSILETTLRLTLRSALANKETQRLFSSAETVAEQWPIP